MKAAFPSRVRRRRRDYSAFAIFPSRSSPSNPFNSPFAKSMTTSVTSSCMMSAAQPSISPTLGRVLPKSPWTNSLTYVPACVFSLSVKNLDAFGTLSHRQLTIVLGRVIDVRRCSTLTGVDCWICKSLMPLSMSSSSKVSGFSAQHIAVYSFSFSSLASCIALYAAASVTCMSTAATAPPSAASSAASIAARASAVAAAFGRLGL
mmetsp:Transcript_9518/g.37064  ORF Transcript_9518/g.37064 Transcript_9518/m.37064 type:complete len:205 (+) Transcript_9518:698-1312(+)